MAVKVVPEAPDSEVVARHDLAPDSLVIDDVRRDDVVGT
jgi:hypothetical protein